MNIYTPNDEEKKTLPVDAHLAIVTLTVAILDSRKRR